MRCAPVVVLVVGLLAGCRSGDVPTDSPRPVQAVKPTKGGGLGELAAPPVPATNPPTAAPVVLPTSGRVHSVNPGLRFVVVDYTLGGMPALNSILSVYRNGEKVAQVRLSGPERNGFAAADIVEGFIQVDDEVRVQ